MRLQKVLISVMDAFATAHEAASTYGAIKKSTLACAGILFQKEVNISFIGGGKFFIKHCWWLKGFN